MHIGLLIYGTLDNQSGGYLYDRMLVEHLRATGDQVEVISLAEGNYLRHIRDNLSPYLLDQLGDLRVDLLLQDELNHPSLFNINYSVRKSVSYPIVSIVHHLRSSEYRPIWKNRIYHSVERRYLNSVEAFIFNSQTTRRVVESLIGNEVTGVVAYPAGDRLGVVISLEEIVSRGMQAGPLRLLFLGNVIPRKGLGLLLAALSLIPKELWSLNVVGSLEMDPSHVRSVKRLVNENGFDGKVKFAGFLGAEDLREAMIGSQVLVVPSEYEGFGIAYLEGMGFGLPAIATTDGGAVEIISHKEDGFLIPPGDKNQLVKYLKQLIGDRELLTRMSLAARERYLQHPSWEETTEKIRSFLSEVIQSRRTI
jgi:glycosyltransferase involved in cell wall biosynthesis